ncbi:MAG: calcium-binding protein [Parvularculaceae bacterium]
MWTISIGATNGASQSQINQVMSVVQDAAAYWGRYLDFGGATLDVTFNIVSLGVSTLAQAGSEFALDHMSGGADVYEALTIRELRTGVDGNGASPDIEIDINKDVILAGDFFYGGLANGNVPYSKYDLFTVLLHEIAHGLGFLSFDPAAPGASITTYDEQVIQSAGQYFFTGANAVSIYGSNVPLDVEPSHLKDSLLDVMRPALENGNRIILSALDVAMLADIGLRIRLPTSGADVIYGFERNIGGFGYIGGNDSIDLSDGDDVYYGLSGDDTVLGGLGGDTIIGGDHNDSILGGDGNDQLFGGNHHDTLDGELGDDTLSGGDGSDVLSGGDGFDALYGGAGNDMMNGGADDDLMTGNAGEDTLDGGLGDDTVYGGDGRDIVMGGEGNDNLSGTRDQDFVYGGAGNDTVAGGDGIDFVYGDDGDDIVSGSLGDDRVEGGTGNDTVTGGDGADNLFGGVGDDAIYGGIGNDTLNGEDGNDLLAGADGDDKLFGWLGSDTLYGGGGADTLAGQGDDDVIYGNAGADRLDGDHGNDLLNGGAGDDWLAGAVGNDTLLGDAGNDTLMGSTGVDVLNGGAGDDEIIFTLGDGADVIIGFSAGAVSEDIIRLFGWGAAFDAFSDILAHATDNGVNTVIDFGGGDTLTLNGVLVSQLHQDDFLFT